MNDSKIFFHAVEAGDYATVERFVDELPAIVHQKRKGATALHFAAINNHREIVNLLLASGADLEARDDEFNATPIGWANEQGHVEMVHYLLAKGAKVDLYRAAAFGLIDHVREFLEKDASAINVTRRYGTPIHDASLWGHPRIVELLLEYGADPNLKNRHGQTALSVARQQIQTGCKDTPIVIESRRKEIEAGCREIIEILMKFK